MKSPRTVPHRRPKTARPFKLVVYLSEDENRFVEKAAAASGRSKSAFGADVILAEAKRIVTSTSK
jgi:uncharacterized protein (DUF1778 family)